MKAVIQRCLSASVVVEGETISSIGKGLLVLVGIGHDDTTTDSKQLIRKILNLRLFDGPAPAPGPAFDFEASSLSSLAGAVAVEAGSRTGSSTEEEGSGAGNAEKKINQNPNEEIPNKDRSSAWKKSVMDISGEILCVSQFTLMARTEKGSKPDFHQAMPGTTSKPMYEDFLAELGRAYSPGKIKDGKFAAMMNVSLCNEGPVTILLDTKTSSASKPGSASGSASNGRPATPGLQKLTPEEQAERGKEKARLSKERRSRAKVEWEARKREEGTSTEIGV